MKTMPDRASRPGKRRFENTLLIIILLAGTGLRAWHLNFGLPALNDPDEPLFVMTALDMLREHRLNPQWFGHPATTLFYALAAILAGIAFAGMMLHQWADPAGLASAVYADPSIAILPMRLFIMLVGVGCIWLTYRVGRDAADARVGLIAAALLACNGLHVELSQVIRTDMLASFFMLWSSLHAMRAARSGALRDHMLAGMLIGLAGATKWPSLLFMINGAGAIARGWRTSGWRRSLLLLPVLPVVALVTLLVVSPYLLLDLATVLRDLGGEARPVHPGATGGSFTDNLLWYGRQVLVGGFGVLGACLAAIGLAGLAWRARAFASAALPGALLFLLAIAGQSLIWERWAVPILPFLAIAIAAGLEEILRRVKGQWRPATCGLLLAALMLPMTYASIIRTRVRAHDTRQLASQWVRSHVPENASLLIEDASFDLLAHRGPVLFPLGNAGCVDVHQFLKARPDYQQVGKQRAGKAIVDLGNVEPSLLAGCMADVAIITHYDRYRLEAQRFPLQLAQYDRLMRDSEPLMTFAPQPGRHGGPVVHIVRLRSSASTGRMDILPRR